MSNFAYVELCRRNARWRTICLRGGGLVTGGGLERHGLWGTPTKNSPKKDYWEIYGDLERVERGIGSRGDLR